MSYGAGLKLQALDVSRNKISWIDSMDLPNSLLFLETSYNPLDLMVRRDHRKAPEPSLSNIELTCPIN
jgi:Leucine-rich repeat (LRR) protein